MSTFISIGNSKQKFTRFFNAIHSVIELLPEPIIVQSGYTPFVNNRCNILPFVSMPEFESLVKSSTILIFHAGAGSVIHALQNGRTPIVIPRVSKFGEHIDDHQVEFACFLGNLGKVLVANNNQELRDILSNPKYEQYFASNSKDQLHLQEEIKRIFELYSK